MGPVNHRILSSVNPREYGPNILDWRSPQEIAKETEPCSNVEIPEQLTALKTEERVNDLVIIIESPKSSESPKSPKWLSSDSPLESQESSQNSSQEIVARLENTLQPPSTFRSRFAMRFSPDEGTSKSNLEILPKIKSSSTYAKTDIITSLENQLKNARKFEKECEKNYKLACAVTEMKHPPAPQIKPRGQQPVGTQTRRSLPVSTPVPSQIPASRMTTTQRNAAFLESFNKKPW